MSGTGKSSVISELVALGFKAVDTDDGWCEPLPDGRQRWREDVIAALLDTEDADVVFIAGCEENQVRFRSRFDLVILLSAPAQVMTERLAARAGNPYGKKHGDMDRILADLAAVEPLLRKAAGHEIRATIPLADVVAKVMSLAGFSPRRSRIRTARAERRTGEQEPVSLANSRRSAA
jgi:shikimate kinase